VVLVKTATNAGSQVWIEWLEPFCWGALQIVVVDTPGLMMYNFLTITAIWLWNELA